MTNKYGVNHKSNAGRMAALRKSVLVLVAVLFFSTIVLSGFSTQNAAAFAGGDGSPGNPYQVASWSDLNDVRNNLTASYILATDLNLNSTGYGTYASASANSNSGWLPIGDASTRFQGVFDGDGHTIADLNISRSATANIGLFGATNGSATISDLTLKSANLSGGSRTGGIVGQNQGTITGVHVDGSIILATSTAGGIAGETSGNITLSSVTEGTVTSQAAWGGGLVGILTGGATISRSWTSADAAANNDAGGIAGHSGNGNIANSYATGNVTSYNASSENSFGGLAGVAGNVTNSYATGNVTISGTGPNSGGLYGESGAVTSNAFATGTVSGTAPIGGFGGLSGGSHSNSYSVFGTPIGSGGSTGVSDVADSSVFMGINHTHAVYASWDFDTIWEPHDGALPTLRGNEPVEPPVITNVTPADDSTNIGINSNLVVTFDKDIEGVGGTLLLRKSSDDSLVQTFGIATPEEVAIDGQTMTMNPTDSLAYNESYYVIIMDGETIREAGTVDNYFVGLDDETDWNFTTIGPDSDSDGTSTESEDAGPNDGDGNDDGSPDSEQSFVTSVPNSIVGGGAYMTIEIDNEDCTELTNVSVVSKASLGSDSNFDYPVGLIDFGVICSGNGDSTEVTIYYDKVYDTTAWQARKYINSAFQNLTGATFGTADIGGTQVTTMTYALTDGGPLDADGLANGQIQDPAGPAVLGSATSNNDLTNTGQGILITTLLGTVLIFVALAASRIRDPSSSN